MWNLKKSQEKLQTVIVSTAVVSLAFAALACDRSQPAAQLTGGASDAKAATDRIAEADSLWEGREDLNKARVALASLRQARTSDPSSYEAAWKLARAAFYVGDHTDNDSERADALRDGTEAGKAAIQMKPDKPEGHFWLGANYGSSAAHSMLAGLSSFQDIKNEMEAVLKIDEGFEGYSAYLGMGRLYLEAPRVLGGDVNKAIEYLAKGLKKSPNNTMMRAELARAYVAEKRDAEAKKEIDTVLAATPDPQHTAEHKDAVAQANKLLSRIR
jgi:tetratricopeptide (TPR) repeat protein